RLGFGGALRGAEVRGHRHVLEDGELPERPRNLERTRDPEVADLVGREAGELLRAEAHRAGGRRERARHAVEEGGLARAVRADEAEDLALLHLEGGGVPRGEAAEALRGAGDG